MNPRAELLKLAINLLRKLQTLALRVESFCVHTKLDLIAKLHGEQSTYGW